MEDNLSKHSADYAKFRPGYPLELIEGEMKAAWGASETTEIRFKVLTRIGKV